VHAAYTPGSVFKLVTAVAAISEFADLDERRFVCDGSWQIGENTVICNSVHGEIDFDEAIAKSCNVTFAQLSTELGKERLTKYAKAAGIEQSLEFDGLKTKAGSFDLTDAGEYAVAWSGVGQYTDSINPCQFMTFVGAIANGGIAAQPYLVESTYCGGTETYKARLRYGSRLMDAEVANRLVLSMHEAVVNNYGEDRFPAQLYVGAKSGTAEQDGEKAANALFVGFTRNENFPLAFIVVIEEGGSGSGEGVPVISRVLQACVAAMETEEK
jgi:peptidoglycan glycosyltransferase